MIVQAEFVRKYLEQLTGVVQNLPLGDIERLLETLERALREQCLVLLAGNGGSAATASHMANDLAYGVAQGGGLGFRAISLSDNVPAMTAIANDREFEDIFATQLRGLAQPGDMLLVISGSGNSPNLLRAVESAQAIGMTTLAILGMGGGKLSSMVDVSVVTPSDEYGPIEDVHMILDHLITAYFRNLSAASLEP